jgi:bifunctional non-homologous end joining protein LigD
MTQDTLDRYREKRRFDRTSEPEGADSRSDGRLYVIQKHAARRLHYDLRLQFGDVLKSWAVTRGPSLDPADRRLAVHVEDHPLEYGDFEGIIPKGQYGGGAVLVWDRGTWVPVGDPEESYRKGRLKFRLLGKKLQGGWTLARMHSRGERTDNWLLIKERDTIARPGEGDAIYAEAPESVLSGRPIESLQAEAEAPPKRPARRSTWAPNPGKLAGAQPAPLPPFLPPQLATASAAAPDGAEWLHEIKFDGYRTLARLDKGDVRLLTRNGLDWSGRYGDLPDAFRTLPAGQALIDGEIVVQDDAGISSFARLQEALSQGAGDRLLFYAFDLIYLDGFDLSPVALIDRKQALAALMEPFVDEASPLQLSEHVIGGGREFLAQAAQRSLEGIVCKRLDAPYQSGRTRTWRKVKCVNADDFVIVGFTESEAAGGLAALLLAEPQDGGLRYVGKVGTGFSARQAEELRARAFARPTPALPLPSDVPKRGVTWTEPKLLAEVRFATRTAEGRLRQASFQGLLQDRIADQAAVVEAAQAQPAPRRRLITDEDLAAVWVTNPDREMFGPGGPTKLDLAVYYAAVGDWMLPELLRRPVSLVRCPTGEQASCFFQRHASPGMPPSVKKIPLREQSTRKRADYVFIDDARGFLGLAQFGTVEFHPWGCRVDKPETPDRMIFDLDPDEALRWREVVEAGVRVHDALEAVGLAAFVKTTGGKGIHVVVPLVPARLWEAVFHFSRALAVRLAETDPRRFTANMAKASRRGRIFIDFHRNRRSSTAVAAYSLRAKPGAPVSTPLSWQELGELDDPRELDWSSVPKRLLERHADPWQDMDKAAGSITTELEARVGVKPADRT